MSLIGSYMDFNDLPLFLSLCLQFLRLSHTETHVMT